MIRECWCPRGPANEICPGEWEALNAFMNEAGFVCLPKEETEETHLIKFRPKLHPPNACVSLSQTQLAAGGAKVKFSIVKLRVFLFILRRSLNRGEVASVMEVAGNN